MKILISKTCLKYKRNCNCKWKSKKFLAKTSKHNFCIIRFQGQKTVGLLNLLWSYKRITSLILANSNFCLDNINLNIGSISENYAESFFFSHLQSFKSWERLCFVSIRLIFIFTLKLVLGWEVVLCIFLNHFVGNFLLIYSVLCISFWCYSAAVFSLSFLWKMCGWFCDFETRRLNCSLNHCYGIVPSICALLKLLVDPLPQSVNVDFIMNPVSCHCYFANIMKFTLVIFVRMTKRIAILRSHLKIQQIISWRWFFHEYNYKKTRKLAKLGQLCTVSIPRKKIQLISFLEFFAISENWISICLKNQKLIYIYIYLYIYIYIYIDGYCQIQRKNERRNRHSH